MLYYHTRFGPSGKGQCFSPIDQFIAEEREPVLCGDEEATLYVVPKNEFELEEFVRYNSHILATYDLVPKKKDEKFG